MPNLCLNRGVIQSLSLIVILLFFAEVMVVQQEASHNVQQGQRL